MKTLLMTTAVAIALGLAGQAHATLVISATDNGVPITLTPTVNSAGILNVNDTADPAFSSITVDSTGSPAVPQPALGSTTLDIHHVGAGTNTLVVTVTQTGLSTPAGFNSQTTMTTNGLIGSPGPSTLEMLVDGSLLDTHTFPASATVATQEFNNVIASGITSDQQIYTVTFTGLQAAQDTIAFVAAPVSEPGMLGIIGLAVLGVGWWSYRRHRIDTAAA